MPRMFCREAPHHNNLRFRRHPFILSGPSCFEMCMLPLSWSSSWFCFGLCLRLSFFFLLCYFASPCRRALTMHLSLLPGGLATLSSHLLSFIERSHHPLFRSAASRGLKGPCKPPKAYCGGFAVSLSLCLSVPLSLGLSVSRSCRAL